MNILISGGAKNGKSDIAERIARRMVERLHKPLYYVATMIPADEEDRERIRRHRESRAGAGFRTLEAGTNILGVLELSETDPGGIFLVDSTTSLMANEMFPPPGDAGFRFDPAAADRVPEELAAFAARTGNTVFVSDQIYADARMPEPGLTRADTGMPEAAGTSGNGPDQPLPDLTEVYRSALGKTDCRLAAECDAVLEVMAGSVKVWKGEFECDI